MRHSKNTLNVGIDWLLFWDEGENPAMKQTFPEKSRRSKKRHREPASVRSLFRLGDVGSLVSTKERLPGRL